MSYYQSQAGDYKTYGYAGDPGFLSSLWRGVKKIAAPILGGMIAGPWGAAIGAAAVAPKPRPPSFPGVGQAAMGFTIAAPPGWKYPPPKVVPGAGARGPSMPGWVSPTTKGMTFPPGQAGVCPSGYHYAKDGSGRLVRNRRMNVANPRALRRSMRRVQGFEKLARRTITFTRRVKMRKRKSS